MINNSNTTGDPSSALNDVYKTIENLDVKIKEAESSGDSSNLSVLKGQMSDMINYVKSSQSQVTDSNKTEPTENSTEIPDIEGVGLPQAYSYQKDATKQLGKFIALQYNIPEEKLDLSSGVSPSDKLALGFMPTQDDKTAYLKLKFGDKNVTPIEIGDTSNHLINKDGKSILANPPDISLKDILSPIGQVIPITSAALAGAATAATGGGVIATPMAAQGAYLGASSAQDALVRAITGQKINPSEIASRRIPEAAIGLATEGLGLAVAKGASKLIGPAIVNESANALEAATKTLNRQGFDVTAPIGTPNTILRQQALAAQFPNSGIAKKMQQTRDILGGFQSSLTDSQVSPSDQYMNVVGSIKDEYNNLVDSIAQNDKNAASIVQKSLNEKINALANPDFDKEALGKDLVAAVSAGKQKTNDIKTQLYEDFKSSNGDVQVPAEDVLSITKKALNKFEYLSNPEVDRIAGILETNVQNAKKASKLELLIQNNPKAATEENLATLQDLRENSKPLGLQKLDEYIKSINDAVPDGGAIGGKSSQQVASTVAGSLRRFRDTILEDSGLTDAYNVIKQHLMEKVGLFEQGTPEGILSKTYAYSDMTPSEMIHSTLSDSQNTKEVLKAASLSSPEAEANIREKLQKAYLDKIGLTQDRGINENFNFDHDVINELWGKTSDGKVDVTSGNQMIEKLNDLKQAFKNANVDMSGISPNDIDSLFKTLSTDDRKSVIKNIVNSKNAAQEADNLLSNYLIKSAKDGKWESIDSPEFVKAMYNASSSDRNSILNRMSLSQRKSFNNDFVAHAMSYYPPETNMTTNGVQLWGSDKFLEDASGPDGRILKNKITSVLGNDLWDSWYDASKVLSANTVGNDAKRAFELKTISTLGRAIPIIAKSFAYTKDRLAAAAYGSNTLIPYMKAIAKDVGQDRVNANFQKMVAPVIASDQGIRSIIHQSRNSPAFAADSQQLLNDLHNGK